MVQKLLTIINEGDASGVAAKYACELAVQKKVPITGLAVIDTPWVTSARLDPLGGMVYKLYDDDELLNQSHNATQQSLDDFSKYAKSCGIKTKAIEVQGSPLEEIESIANEHDVIILGKTTNFRATFDSRSDEVVTKLIRYNTRPVIVVPDNYKTGHQPLIAYDGTVESARALHIFLLMAMSVTDTVDVLTIKSDQTIAQHIIVQAVNMCSIYNIKVNQHCICSSADPSGIIARKSEELDSNIVVMGTSRYATLTEMLFGSCTMSLLKKSKCPIFIYH